VGSDEFDVVDLGVSDELIDVQQSARSVAVNPGWLGCGVSRRDGVPSHRACACSGVGCTLLRRRQWSGSGWATEGVRCGRWGWFDGVRRPVGHGPRHRLIFYFLFLLYGTACAWL
jgi:hypothetical protein